MHTLWAREHNRLAKGLRKLNPGWNSNRVFQEARKILGAIMQHVTYNEWIPAILAPEIVSQMYYHIFSGSVYIGSVNCMNCKCCLLRCFWRT